MSRRKKKSFPASSKHNESEKMGEERATLGKMEFVLFIRWRNVLLRPFRFLILSAVVAAGSVADALLYISGAVRHPLMYCTFRCYPHRQTGIIKCLYTLNVE
jgi:hypothetical protein